MPRTVPGLCVLLAVYCLAGHSVTAGANDQLVLGAGRPGSESHQLGVGLTSLVKVVVLPKEGIDLELKDQSSTPDGKDLLVAGQVEMQVLLADEPADDFRSVMTFRSTGTTDGLVLELVARADVPADTIHHITQAIFENGPFLNTISEAAWDLSIDRALLGVRHAIHPGALRYYQESSGISQQTAAVPSQATGPANAGQDAREFQGESTFFIYFGQQDVRLDGAAQEQIAAACRYAASSQSPQVNISGPSRQASSDAAEGLAQERLQSVMTALAQDANCGPDLTITALAEAEATLPPVLLNADDDRIEVTIMLP